MTLQIFYINFRDIKPQWFNDTALDCIFFHLSEQFHIHFYLSLLYFGSGGNSSSLSDDESHKLGG